MLVDVLGTAALSVPPFLVGALLGASLPRYRRSLLIATTVPGAYFGANLAVALARQGLRETLVLGIPLGNSPVFAMLLTATTAGTAAGVAAGWAWETRQTGTGPGSDANR